MVIESTLSSICQDCDAFGMFAGVRNDAIAGCRCSCALEWCRLIVVVGTFIFALLLGYVWAGMFCYLFKVSLDWPSRRRTLFFGGIVVDNV